MKKCKTVFAVLLISILSGPGLFAGIPLENANKAGKYKQQRVITGTVTGANNTPMSGVSVKLKGTSSGTMTDSAGKYTIVIPNAPGTLTYTHVGCDPQEHALAAGEATVNIQMSCED